MKAQMNYFNSISHYLSITSTDLLMYRPERGVESNDASPPLPPLTAEPTAEVGPGKMLTTVGFGGRRPLAHVASFPTPSNSGILSTIIVNDLICRRRKTISSKPNATAIAATNNIDVRCNATSPLSSKKFTIMSFIEQE